MSSVRAATEVPHESFLLRVGNFLAAPFRFMKKHPFSTALMLAVIVSASVFAGSLILFPAAFTELSMIGYPLLQIGIYLLGALGGIGVAEFFRYIIIFNHSSRPYELILDLRRGSGCNGSAFTIPLGASLGFLVAMVLGVFPLVVVIGIGTVTSCVTLTGACGLLLKRLTTIRPHNAREDDANNDNESNSNTVIYSQLNQSPTNANDRSSESLVNALPPSLEDRLTVILEKLDEAHDSYAKTAKSCGQNPIVTSEYRLTAEEKNTISIANDIASQTIMTNPVILFPSGHSVDSITYDDIKIRNNRCPNTRAFITNSTENLTLKSLIVSSIESIIVRVRMMINQLKNKEEEMQKIKSDTLAIHHAPIAPTKIRRFSA